jgi:hypothetical protein
MLTYQQIAHEGWRPPETAPHGCEIMVEFNDGTVTATRWVADRHPNYEAVYPGQWLVLGNGRTGWAIERENLVYNQLPRTDIAGWSPLGKCGAPTS